MRDPLDKRMVVVTGKGGVGKSTVALALALTAAARGKRTIVCEVGGQEQISSTFHRAAVGFHEVEMADELWAISIDPDESIREYLGLQLKVKAMSDVLVRSRMFTYLAAATPGLKELVTIGKLWELAQPERRVRGGRAYDLVVVDAPATGHGVGLLQTPRTFARIARAGPISAQARTLHRFITNHKTTGVVVVALPEEMPVNETATLEGQLADEVGAAVDRVIVNGLYPERFSATEVEAIAAAAAGANDAVGSACRAAISQGRRAADQRKQLERLRGLVDAPVSTLPFLFTPELRLEHARELAAAVAEAPT